MLWVSKPVVYNLSRWESGFVHKKDASASVATAPQIFKVDTLDTSEKKSFALKKQTSVKNVFIHQASAADRDLISNWNDKCSDTIRKMPFSNF